jgi:chromosome segregation ATPase
MSDATKRLQEIVDDVARTGALTPAAIKQFDQLRQQVEVLESRLEEMTKDRDQQKTLAGNFNKAADRLGEELKVAAGRINIAEARIAKADQAIWQAEHLKARGDELRGILSDVFRNFEFNRNFHQSSMVPVPNNSYPGAAPTMHTSSESLTETKTIK